MALTEAQRRIAETGLDASRSELLERIRFQASLAEKALAALMIANGGAIVGLFTLIGHLTAAGSALALNARCLWIAFIMFSLGVAAILLAYVMAFLSQERFYFATHLEGERHKRTLVNDEVCTDVGPENVRVMKGLKFYATGIVMAVVAIITFVAGAAFALMGVLPR